MVSNQNAQHLFETYESPSDRWVPFKYPLFYPHYSGSPRQLHLPLALGKSRVYTFKPTPTADEFIEQKDRYHLGVQASNSLPLTNRKLRKTIGFFLKKSM